MEMTLLYERDYNVRLMDLPPRVPGFVRKVEDYNTIVLNAHLSREQNRKTFEHDLWHLENDDYSREESINIIEANAHKKSAHPVAAGMDGDL